MILELKRSVVLQNPQSLLQKGVKAVLGTHYPPIQFQPTIIAEFEVK